MRRWNRYLTAALLLGGITGLVTWMYLRQLDQRIPVVVPTVAVAPYTMLEPRMLRTVLVPAQGVHPQALRQVDEAAGRFTLTALWPGEQVLSGMLSAASGPSSLRARLADTARAMFLPATASHVLGGAISPGDRIDVVFVRRGLDGPVSAQVLVEDLTVLDVRTEQGRAYGDAAEEPIAGALVAVEPEQAQKLALALEAGSLYILLRGYAAVAVPTSPIPTSALNGK